MGSIEAAKNKEELKRLNITHILTVANYMIPLYPNEFVYKIINGKNLLQKQFSYCKLLILTSVFASRAEILFLI